uniref:Major facilitator superfamily (MFS) profile domain-containing protein n=1 Tax=Salix viminalis TaxID=40686 RepID=A0A6N2N4Y4_SALVM
MPETARYTALVAKNAAQAASEMAKVLECITFAVPAEIFPARLRSTCHGISTASGKAGATVGAFGFLYAVDDIGVRGILIILGVVNFLGLMFTFSVPESKGKSLRGIAW